MMQGDKKQEQDGFYRAFEDRFRGSRDSIRSRLEFYLPFVQPLMNIEAAPKVIDLGCGRGEWLELLRDHKFDVQGVDLDEGMLSACRKIGLPVAREDALSFLQKVPNESQCIISGFHIAEHLPFEVLKLIVKEAIRVLKPAGLLILETPNPENLAVASLNFYLDPTHNNPLPPQLLAFLPEYYGFDRVKVVRLQESKDVAASDFISLYDVLHNASPDYAIVAQKKASADHAGLFNDLFSKNFGLSGEALIDRFDRQLTQTRHEIHESSERHQRELETGLDKMIALTSECQKLSAEALIDRFDKQLTQARHEIQEMHESSERHQRELESGIIKMIALTLEGQKLQDEHDNLVRLIDERQREMEAYARKLNSLKNEPEEMKETDAQHFGSRESFRDLFGLLRWLSDRPRWFVNGAMAWVTLKQGSRPRRIARKIFDIARLILQRSPFLHQAAHRLLRLGSALGVSVPRVGTTTPLSFSYSGIPTATPLNWETRSTRLVLERLEAVRKDRDLVDNALKARPRLAYVSPLLPLKTGIADYSNIMLQALALYYDIDAVVDQPTVEIVSPPCVKNILNPEEFSARASEYDRVLYHIGNSPFHVYMLPLLEQYPGVVVLHDVYIGRLLYFIEGTTGNRAWTEELYRSHGYSTMRKRFHPPGQEDELCKLHPVCHFIFRHAQGVIVHSEFARQRVVEQFGDEISKHIAIVPMLGETFDLPGREIARRSLGISNDAFVVCSFGNIVRIKAVKRLLEAFLQSSLAQSAECYLFFVGADTDSEYCAEIQTIISESGLEDRIKITGFVSLEEYRAYLSCADLAVQLREETAGETSKAAADCLVAGLPIIMNAYGAAAELPDEVICKISQEFDERELAAMLERLHANSDERALIAQRARLYSQNYLSAASVAEQYHSIIEAFEAAAPRAASIPALLLESADLSSKNLPRDAWVERARALAEELPSLNIKRIFVDVSTLIRHDLRTGIQRVVRAQILGLLQNPPIGYRVEPVWITNDADRWKIRYARRYCLSLLDLPDDLLTDDPIEPSHGDIYYMVDFYVGGVIAVDSVNIWNDLRRRGVQLNFLVYDILPISHPQYFPPGTSAYHIEWLKTLTRVADRLLCISQDVVQQVQDWQRANCPGLTPPPCYALHLGADTEASAPTRGMPEWAAEVLRSINSRTTFLMVGTLEPRKGYAQALAAFERLWSSNVDVNLVIVGKEGWNIAPIVEKLRDHSERHQRLFWLDGISDEFLEIIYAGSTCLIASSEGEGFGLPLIEAAQHKIPILARDIPVFREVAGQYASYFSGLEPDNLACAIEAWLVLYKENAYPKSDGMPWLTWAENVERLKSFLLSQIERQP